MAMDNVQQSDVPNLNGQGQPKGLAALDRNATQAERNRVIDEFFESFGTWDWLYARSKCRHANFDQSPLVTFSNLPLDVLHLITIHLSLPDMIKCRLVSKSWNNLWSDRVVNGVLIRKHFPGAFECLGHSMPAAKLLVQLVRQHSIQGWAKWAATHISWNMGTEAALNSARDGIVSRTLPSSLGSYPPRFIFADGKVAWQAMPSCVVIDDLVAETWQRVSLISNRLHGISSRLIGFSGVMVLVGDEDNAPEDQGPRPSCRKLIVHHLPSDIQKSIVLPNNLVKCFTYKNSAVFVTRGPEAFVFTWGGMLRQLDISVDKGDTIPATCTQDGTAVLFHPVDQGTIFVVSAFYIPEADPEPLTTSGRHRGPKLHSIVVTKYRQGLLEHQKIMPVHVREMTMKIHKANEFGLYSICISNSKGGGRKHVTLLYNVVTESFYEIASGSPANHDWDDSSIITYSMLRQLWNSHLFTSTTSRQDHSEDMGHSFKLAVDSCNAMTAVSESPPRNPRSLSMKMWQHEIRHQERSESPRISFPRTFDISNDFVVICYEKGYFVLCAHGREIRLKEQSTIEDGCQMK